ncbi:ABC transporter transmembrane domain-containing protein [Lactobacillus jensenii]|jgi:ABC transporter, ATP-binding protein|uniref:ABC transporter transmembrane domain-containing protein n=3 Tax=Lactobacillus jensenii TaxID=109790 RepID=A0A5N1IFW0_LACJE|nr:ABC transporter transmembrane domain-containing protein [Lactobacillus jensenii]EEQ68677.1 ABC transporter, ATP-binding protein [Lactobacillus jensenii 1153]ERJ44728.1 ABC transporter ATP-binding protein [Lactobacillus jensenii MD IIE-70(2)]MCT7681736.1 ABC transporter transmembrane domain-containing protein [Lactobacillus crispatus]EEQ24853.1 ABC transporter, ATP-binding protein [Lactobacillus jensenii 269-3]EEX27843.1 ABC transporter, ATP-binding protein [Lactobacillus jensenii SJ-7A-US]
MDIFIKLSWFFKKYKKRYFLGILFLILTSFANLIPPLALGRMAELLNQGKISWLDFFINVLGIIVAALFLYMFRLGWRSQLWGGAQILARDLTTKLYWHFLKMDRTFYQRHRTGDLMAHATNDITAIQFVAGDGVLALVDAVFTGGTTLIAMMIFVDWRLTLIAMIPMPLLALMARFLGTKLHEAYRHSQEAFSQLNNKTQESITGIKVLKTFGQAQEDIAAFDKMTYDTIRINKRVFKIDSLYDPLTTLIIGFTYIITIIVGGQMVQTNEINIGQLVSFVAYIASLEWPMFAIGYLFNLIERGSASYKRVMSLLSEKSLIKDQVDHTVDKITGNLEVNIDKFKYPDEKNRLALQKINFNLKPGQTLGLVGKVGAGKSTIIELLMRDFDNYQGQIKLAGKNIKDIALDSYLGEISYVPQDNFLFSVSIADNIRFAEPEASLDQIRQAAQEAALDTDIMLFPNKYDTLVGENGVSLSGGQKQRLAIARALIKDSQILILDDALSAVDAKTEKSILNNLQKCRKDKTTIIAAHRLSSVMKADLILVLKDGQVIERGTHDQLLAENGWYKEMWDRQELEKKVGEGIE